MPLYGTHEQSRSLTNNGSSVSVQKIPDEEIVVPSIGANLGINYCYRFHGADFIGRVGYEATEYLGINKGTRLSNTNDNSGVQGFSLGFLASF